MGGGSFSYTAYSDYSRSLGKTIDTTTGFISSGQVYKAVRLDESLNPENAIRECCNTEEHPNTIPVILALDVTGSMGAACKKTAEALGVIMKELYERFEDIEFMVMGIGDLDYDRAPIQASQFESDVRIAVNLDKIYMEHGGGGNQFESYTSAWYFGLHNTKLDCFDLQERKGIIITMGDEPLNPYLPHKALNNVLGCNETKDVETKPLYEEALKKFDIFHISVDDSDDNYNWHKSAIESSFGELLGERSKVSTINDLHKTIIECITESLRNSSRPMKLNESDEISW